MQNFEIGFASTKLGESFNSKSANNSRFVRAMNCLAFFPVTTKVVLAGSKFAGLAKQIRVQCSAESLVRADD